MGTGTSAELAEALADLRAGGMVVVCAVEGNSPLLAVAASHADADAVNFMAREGRGLVSLALTPERCEELGLEQIPTRSPDGRETEAFTVSIEAREGVSTGISAADRARTIAVAIDPACTSDDICSPGHVFPIRARPGGVLERGGGVEAAVDLVRAAGLFPAAAICAILDDDGRSMRSPELERFCARHRLRRVTSERIAEMRREREALVQRVSGTRLRTEFGDFEAITYRSLLDGSQHQALVKGQVAGRSEVLVRVHVACARGEAFRALGCRCNQLLESALARIAAEGEGVLLYLSPRPGEEHDCDLGLGAQILADLGLSSLRLLISDPRPTEGLERHGLSLVDEITVEVGVDSRDEGFVRV